VKKSSNYLTPDGMIYAKKLMKCLCTRRSLDYVFSTYVSFEEREEWYVAVSPHGINSSRQLQWPSVYVGWT